MITVGADIDECFIFFKIIYIGFQVGETSDALVLKVFVIALDINFNNNIFN